MERSNRTGAAAAGDWEDHRWKASALRGPRAGPWGGHTVWPWRGGRAWRWEAWSRLSACLHTCTRAMAGLSGASPGLGAALRVPGAPPRARPAGYGSQGKCRL